MTKRFILLALQVFHEGVERKWFSMALLSFEEQTRSVGWSDFRLFFRTSIFHFLADSKITPPYRAVSQIFPAQSPDGIAQRSFEDGVKRTYNTTYFQAVLHPSTIAAQSCLSSVIGRELVISTW